MTVSQRQIDLVQKSLAGIRRNLQPSSVYFYEALFRRDPSLRRFFRDDLSGQGMKFMSTLVAIVDNLATPEALDARFGELGHDHARIGIKAAHFDTMGEALIDTIAHELGDKFTPETEEAWRAAYVRLSATLISRGNIVD